MKMCSLRKLLLLAVSTLACHNTAWSQCVVYGASFKGSTSGQYSSSWSGKGYTIIGPSETMQDGVTRRNSAAFQIYSGKGGKAFEYNIRYFIDGNPSSGGLLVGLVKQGKTLRVLVSTSDVFDSSTISGTAILRNVPGIGSTFIANTLSGSYSYWGQEEDRPIGDSTSTANNPVKVYKYSSTDIYTYNPTFTASVAGKTFDEAVEWVKQSLISQGYTDLVENPY
jgi:hypothetical protein